jgi:hypothetical protein
MKRILVLSCTIALAWTAEDPATLWTTKVQPLINERCIQCHGPEKSKGKLRLDSREAMLKGGRELGPIIVPDKPETSPLLKVCTLPRNEELAMPPEGKGKPLSAEELGWLKAWLVGGAPTPAAAK